VNWTDILLEIRALLHEPLRYHPNIVRLLSLGWGSSSETGSIYPTLILEYAAFGSLHHLQANSLPLPFSIKQKLCYDVARGLSILHACGIVHGDLKHENVLVFENRYDTLKGQPYTAKLADFGGAVMDIAEGDSHFLRMGTFPYDAPEAGQPLNQVGTKKTDVYSFGMLVWRAFIDGGNIVTELGLHTQPRASAQDQLREWKLNDDLLVQATNSVISYSSSKDVPTEATDLILFALNVTIRAQPDARDFVAAQARLRGMNQAEVENYLNMVVSTNQREMDNDRSEAPGKHGMTVDTVGYQLGQLGDDYDAQNNLPGCKAKMPYPEVEGFHFEPSKLKEILDWDQQEMMVENFKEAAQAVHWKESTEPPPWKAAYYLFLCYLTEFGVEFDAEKVCHWLYQTAKVDDEGDVDYWAQAWVWRVFAALSVPLHLERDRLLEYLRFGQVRGHRNCLEDSNAITLQLPDDDEKRRWASVMKEADGILRTAAGGVGMPHYVHRKLRRPYDLHNLRDLDAHIKSELGEAYGASIKSRISLPGTFPSDEDDQKNDDEKNGFDKIYVNHKGHGLLHYAASMGNFSALRHLVEKYQCNIDLPNQSLSESPLVCACRSGHYTCAVFLLDHGADANGTHSGQESPLHWLCSMQPEQMALLAKQLIDAGADLEKHSGIMRKDVRMINADWENVFGIPVTPLGRAVLMRSLPAVKTLLELGADPLEKTVHNNVGNKSAVELAAVLTLPHILEVLLSFVDQRSEQRTRIFDEIGMLKAAHAIAITEVDSTTLHSRLIRCGPNYRTWMFRTLQILHDRQEKTRNWTNLGGDEPAPGMQFCHEVKLGNVDIVEALLALGHDPKGSPEHRPIEEAVLMNHSILFRILVNGGAGVNSVRRSGGWMHFNLLQLSAARPRTSRSGNFIAEYLLRAGVALEPLPDGTPSALVLAIKNRYFDLADLLIAHGADINALYQIRENGPWGTVLKELLSHHSYASLESINYLFKRPNVNNLAPMGTNLAIANHLRSKVSYTPAFIVDRTQNLSALHILARCSLEVINHRSQISASIIDRIMEAFNKPEQINHTHPILGTPLCVAAMTGNVEMVTILLEARAEIAIYAQMPESLTDSQISVLELPRHFSQKRQSQQPTPLKLALETFEAELRGVRGLLHGSNAKDITSMNELQQLKRIERVIICLQQAASASPNNEKMDTTENDSTNLQASLQVWKEELKLDVAMKRMKLGPDDEAEANRPVDLSRLSEEKPSGWTEGCEMTNEMSMRIFLRYFRTGK
jgi:ankyrin repeat protein